MQGTLMCGIGINRKTSKEIKFSVSNSISAKGWEAFDKNVEVISLVASPPYAESSDNAKFRAAMQSLSAGNPQEGLRILSKIEAFKK